MDDLESLDATAQAELVRSGDVSPLEFVDAAINRIEKLEQRLNAFRATMFDEARELARAKNLPGGPFHGVPFAVKDLGFHLKGAPTYEGNRVLKEIDFRSPIESPIGARIRAAGFIVVGKTATPEFGAQPTTQPLAFGPTRNPWDLERSVSGSSGGSGAVVASGMLAAAHASDGGGSIRQPASWCGLVGLKPSRGRMSRPRVTSRLGTELAVTKSVRDTAAILDALHGSEPGDLYTAPPPNRPYAEEVGQDPGKLRVGVLTKVDHPAVDVHPEAVLAAENAAKLIESLGHLVSTDAPASLFDEDFLHHAEIDYGSRMLATFSALWRAIGRELVADDVEPYTWARMQRAERITAQQLVQADSWLQAYSNRIISWWDDFDLLVTPTTGEPPALLKDLEVNPSDAFDIDVSCFARIRCFVRPFNVTGQPAISLPLHVTAAGLPQGVQLVAAPYREDLLIRVASQIEEAAPWAERKPTL